MNEIAAPAATNTAAAAKDPNAKPKPCIFFKKGEITATSQSWPDRDRGNSIHNVCCCGGGGCGVGTCRAGKDCKFPHEAAPAKTEGAAPKQPRKPKADGKEAAPAAAAGGAAAAPRPKADPKVTPCKFWARGTCRSGKECAFIHQGESGHAAQAAGAPKQPRQPAAAGTAAAPAAGGDAARYVQNFTPIYFYPSPLTTAGF